MQTSLNSVLEYFLRAVKEVCCTDKAEGCNYGNLDVCFRPVLQYTTAT